MATPLKKLTSIVQKASAKHTATVIFIHGLGDSGAGWQVLSDLNVCAGDSSDGFEANSNRCPLLPSFNWTILAYCELIGRPLERM